MYGLEKIRQQLEGKEFFVAGKWWRLDGAHFQSFVEGKAYAVDYVPAEYQRLAGDCGAINVAYSHYYLEKHHFFLRKFLPKVGINQVFLSLSSPLTGEQCEELDLTFRFTKSKARANKYCLLYCYTWDAPEEEMKYGYFWSWAETGFPTRKIGEGK